MRWLLVILDMVAVNAAYYIALNARFFGYDNLSELFHQKLDMWERFTPLYTIICIAVFAAFKLYNGMWKYAGMHDFNRILFSSIITSAIHVIATSVFMEGFPKTYYILGTILQFFLLGSIRLGYRINGENEIHSPYFPGGEFDDRWPRQQCKKDHGISGKRQGAYLSSGLHH